MFYIISDLRSWLDLYERTRHLLVPTESSDQYWLRDVQTVWSAVSEVQEWSI